MSFCTSLIIPQNGSVGGNWLKEEEEEVSTFLPNLPRPSKSEVNNNSFVLSHPLQSSMNDRRWNPYINNGGSVIAVAGEDYAIIAGDTRLSLGFSIFSRSSSKLTKLTEQCIIATSGMQADMDTLHRNLKARIISYEHAHRCPPSVYAVAQLLSTILYYRRFLPYYTFNLLAGLDSEGKGVVFGYDAIGSYDAGSYFSSGTGGNLMLSILDNQISQSNQLLKKNKPNKLEMINLVKDCIISATERDIFTGDSAEVAVIDKSGLSITILELRKD